MADGRCSCPHGFSGPGCLDRTCEVRCENGGVCSTGAGGGVDRCTCPKGFYGSRCHKR